MDIPEIWLFFGSQIHQDFLIDHPDFLTGIIELLGDFSSSQKVELLKFLNHIHSSNLSNLELSEVWRNSGSEIFVSGEKIDLLFDELFLIVKKQTTIN